MAIPNKFEKIRYEIERRFKMYAKEAEGSDKFSFWQDAASEVNDVFDPYVSPLSQCPKCGAMNAFEIDTKNPKDGYCYAEDKVWSLKFAGTILSKCSCGHSALSHLHYTEGDYFCSAPSCDCEQFNQQREVPNATTATAIIDFD